MSKQLSEENRGGLFLSAGKLSGVIYTKRAKKKKKKKKQAIIFLILQPAHCNIFISQYPVLANLMRTVHYT